MNHFNYTILALCACLLVTTAVAEEEPTQAKPQAKEGKGDGVAAFDAGVAAYQADDLPAAYKSFLAAAEAGHADSQYNLALMYERGIGVAKDEKEAVLWYEKSAKQGNPAAQFNVGVLYENGRGTKVDFAKAHQWYRKASEQGDPLAVGNLGMLYVRAQGVKENKIAGVALLLVSATRDPSPENHAKQNLAGTRGLTPEMIAAAQSLYAELSAAKNLLVPLDQYLKKQEKKTDKPEEKDAAKPEEKKPEEKKADKGAE